MTPRRLRSPLDELLILDLSRVLASVHATMMPGDLGVRVVEAENSAGGAA